MTIILVRFLLTGCGFVLANSSLSRYRLLSIIMKLTTFGGNVLGIFLRNVTYVGSAYGFAKTCNKVYNLTTPVVALTSGVKGIVFNCAPPVIKYPVLCPTLVACSAAYVSTCGNPLVVAVTTNIARTIVLED